ncbi:hypothetical protein AB0B10_30335 [Micromonospora arborensis]|uniref:hypothetical protein n=1 Tax=Micromonospora arborensis TaxID=2116518 RepID=UPI0033C45E62
MPAVAESSLRRRADGVIHSKSPMLRVPPTWVGDLEWITRPGKPSVVAEVAAPGLHPEGDEGHLGV